MHNPKVYGKIAVNMLLLLVFALVTVFIVPKLLIFFLPFVIGWVIAMITNPLVRFLEKRVKIVRKHSSVLIICVALAAVVAGLYFGTAAIVRQLINFLDEVPELFESVMAQLNEAAGQLGGLYSRMPAEVRNFIDQLVSNLSGAAGKILSGIKPISISEAGNLAKNLADVVVLTVITILSSYFIIAEKDNISNVFRKAVPNSVQEKFRFIADNFKMAIGGYFKAQFKIMLILCGLIFIGFELLGIGYSFLFAVLIAVVDFLPILGAGAILWPWALFDLITGNYLRAVCLLVIYLLCQLIKQILQPKMVGDSIGMSPLATLFFMFAGYRLKGVLGMIIGIPIGMVFINFYRIGAFNGIISDVKLVVHDINQYRKH